MIFSISGKKQSGKDAVGKITQYLIWNKKHNVPDITCIDYINGKEDYYEASYTGDIDYKISQECGFEIKKFADKLKDIVCLLINCTREELEDEEFKNTELGEDWWVWRAYEDGTLFSYSGQNMDIKFWELVKLTPRLLLQFIGTEGGREIIHPNIWVNSLMSEYVGKDLYRKTNPSNPWKFPDWIITDCRFPNEAEAVKSRGGLVIRVDRASRFKEEKIPSNYIEHPSETGLDNYEDFDYVIENDGTLEDLIERVREILTTAGII